MAERKKSLREAISRRSFVRTAAGGTAALLAGCGGNTGGDGGTASGDGDGGDGGGGATTASASGGDGDGGTDMLTVMGFRELSDEDPVGSGSAGAVYNHQLRQFEERSGLSVDYRFISIEDYRTQGLSIVDSSEAPAVFETLQGPGSVGQFVDVGAAMDIREPVPDSVWNTRNEEAWVFGDGQLANVGTGTAAYGAPNQSSGFPLWFSIPVLEEAGIDVERVRHANDVGWQEFNGMCQQIKDAGFVPIAMGNRVGGHVPYLLHTAFTKTFEYSTLLDMARGASDRSFTDPEFVEAVTMIKEWYDRGFINQDTLALSEDEAERLIFQQEAAFMTDGIWISYLYYVVDPDNMGPLGEGWDYMWWPYRPDAFEAGKNQLFGHPNGAWTASAQAMERGKMDAVAEFIDFWSALEQEEFRSKNGGLLPSHQDADAFSGEVARAMHEDLTADETVQATMRPDQLFGPDVSQVITNTGPGLFSGSTTPEGLLAEMEEAR